MIKLFFIGLLLLLVSRNKLQTKVFWRVIPPKELKTDGVYKYIRHPMYLGNTLLIFGLFCWLLGLKIGICLTYIYFHFIIDRIDREEQMLVMVFGNKYLEYMKRTKLIIPFIL